MLSRQCGASLHTKEMDYMHIGQSSKRKEQTNKRPGTQTYPHRHKQTNKKRSKQTIIHPFVRSFVRQSVTHTYLHALINTQPRSKNANMPTFLHAHMQHIHACRPTAGDGQTDRPTDINACTHAPRHAYIHSYVLTHPHIDAVSHACMDSTNMVYVGVLLAGQLSLLVPL